MPAGVIESSSTITVHSSTAKSCGASVSVGNVGSGTIGGLSSDALSVLGFQLRAKSCLPSGWVRSGTQKGRLKGPGGLARALRTMSKEPLYLIRADVAWLKAPRGVPAAE